MIRMACALFALLAIIVYSQTAGAEVSITTPPDRSAVTGELLSLVLSLNGTRLDAVDIFVNNRRQKTVAVPQNRKMSSALTASPFLPVTTTSRSSPKRRRKGLAS